jgi:hypothetical protein
VQDVRFTASARKHRIGKAPAIRSMRDAGEPVVLQAPETSIIGCCSSA